LNDRYDTVNISDESGMTDMIQSTYQMEVDDRYDTVNISDGSGMTDMIQSTYQMEVE
jgi:hypothetical protein